MYIYNYKLGYLKNRIFIILDFRLVLDHRILLISVVSRIKAYNTYIYIYVHNLVFAQRITKITNMIRYKRTNDRIRNSNRTRNKILFVTDYSTKIKVYSNNAHRDARAPSTVRTVKQII